MYFCLLNLLRMSSSNHHLPQSTILTPFRLIVGRMLLALTTERVVQTFIPCFIASICKLVGLLKPKVLKVNLENECFWKCIPANWNMPGRPFEKLKIKRYFHLYSCRQQCRWKYNPCASQYYPVSNRVYIVGDRKAIGLWVFSTLKWEYTLPSTTSSHTYTFYRLPHQPPGNKLMFFSLTCKFYYPLGKLLVSEIITTAGHYLLPSLHHPIHSHKYQYLHMILLFPSPVFVI